MCFIKYLLKCMYASVHAKSLQSCLTLYEPMTVAHQAPWNSPGKNTGVGCHSPLLGIFPTQGSDLDLLDCMQILYHLSHQGSSVYVYVCMCICTHTHTHTHTAISVSKLWFWIQEFLKRLSLNNTDHGAFFHLTDA